MQAKIIREAVFKTAAGASFDDKARAEWAKEASRLRPPDAAGHGIDQPRVAGERLREEGKRAAHHGEGYEAGETALQVAIVLLSVALVATPRKIVAGALFFALAGIGIAVASALGVSSA